MASKLTAEQFINNAKQVHGDKYDYSLVKYVNTITPVTITCPIHGQFQQRPNAHVSKKQGCPKCGLVKRSHSKRLTLEQFISKSKQLFPDQFDYSLTSYQNIHTKVTLICKLHGQFKILPTKHIHDKIGCPKCANQRKFLTTDQFIKQAQTIHNNAYDYSLVEYKNTKTKVKIICPRHGIFEQIPNDHLSSKTRCPKCVATYSLLEQQIRNVCQTFTDITTQVKNIIPPFELDIVLPNNVAIEINGMYWHSTKFKSYDYHYNKSTWCVNKNVQLLHIHESLWYSNRLKCIMLIKYACGLITEQQLWPYVWDDYKIIGEFILVDRDTYMGELECIGYYVHSILPPKRIKQTKYPLYDSGRLLLCRKD